MQDPLDSYFTDTTEEDPLDSYFKPPAPPKHGGKIDRFASGAMSSAGSIAGSVFGGLGKIAEMGKERSAFSDIADRFRATAAKHKAALDADPSETLGEKASQFVGEMVPKVAVGGALAKSIFNPITSRIATTRFAGVADRISKLATANKTAQTVIAGGIVAAPAEIAGSYATTAITDPEDLGGALPIVGAVIGSGLSGIIAARGVTQLAKQVASENLANAKLVEVDPRNELFERVRAGAQATLRDARQEFNKQFRTKDLLDIRIGEVKEVRENFTALNKVLKSLEVDGVTQGNLQNLEELQKRFVNTIEQFYTTTEGSLTEDQLKAIAKSMGAIEGMKLPEYNFAAQTPAVGALQRIQDNLKQEQSLRMDPKAPLGSAESLIASTRPQLPSAFSAIGGFFQKARSQYQDYKSVLGIFDKVGGKVSILDQAHLLAGNSARVYQNLEIQPLLFNKGTQEWEKAVIDGQEVLPVNKILKMSGTDDASLAKLNGYMVAKQIADRNLQIEGYNYGWAQGEVARFKRESPEIVKAGNAMFLRSKMIAKYMEDTLDPEVLKEWLQRDYAPASRAVQGPGDAFGFKVARKGGKDLVFNPIQKHIDNVAISIAATEKTMLWQNLHDIVTRNKDEFKGIVDVVASEEGVMQKILVAVKEQNPEMTEVAARKMAALLSGNSLDKSTRTVSFLKDGKMTSLRFNDDFGELFTGFDGVADLGMFWNGLRKVESIPRTAFSLVNDLTLIGPIRDLAETFINDPNLSVKSPVSSTVRLFADYIKGYKEVANEGELYQRVIASGGGIGGRYIGPKSGMAEITYDAVLKKTRGETESFLRKMERVSANLSQASRMGAAIRAFDAGENSTGAAKIFREVIADPQQVGSKMQGLAQYTAFMNMGIQSAAKTVSQFKNSPSSTIAKGMFGIGIPAVTFWWWGKDDAEIQELRRSKGGENYFFVRIPGDDGITRIPKPYLYGQIFGTSIEAALDYGWGKNPDNVTQLARGIMGQMSVNLIPLTLQSLANTALSQKYLGIGEGLVPSGGSTSNQMAQDQRFSNTTTLARKLGESTGIAASNWDDIMRTFLTNEPYKVVATIDRKLTNRTTGTSEDVPFLGKFRPTIDKSNIGSVNHFYNEANKYSDIFKSLQDAERKGDATRLNRILRDNKDEFVQAAAYGEAMKEVQEIRSAISLINENTMMTPDERREKITELNNAMRTFTRMFSENWEGKKK
jgi:hypothetical protein